MAREVKVPKMAEGADSATVSEILVKEGDTVEKEQSLITVESDKASLEVPSDAAGKVKEIKVAEGDEISVGDVILLLEDENGEDGDKEEDEEETPEEDQKEKPEKKEKEKEEENDKEVKEEPKEKKDKDKKEAKPEKEESSQEEEEKNKAKEKDKKEKSSEEEKPQVEAESRSETDEAAAGPSARRLARELSVKLTEIRGSGPEGRILEDDVKAFASEIISGRATAAPESSLPDFSRWGKVERKPLSGIRKTTAQHVASAWRQIPHVTHFDEADVTGLEKFREDYGEEVAKKGGKLTVTAILLKISAVALQEFPEFNASLDMQKNEMVLKHYIHIGIAADTENGLLVPVIRDVDKKPVIDLALELDQMAEKARNQKLTKEEMEGGNFIISNLGGIGGTNFTPIIYQPQVAILGVSRTATKPVWRNEQFEPRQVLPLSLSYDHRMIDGATAARFLRWICEVIEKPYKMLLE